MGYTPPHLNVRKILGGYSVFPDGVTTDDFTISPNPIDTYPYIKLLGNQGVGIYHVAGGDLSVYDATTLYAYLAKSLADSILGAPTDQNLYLKTAGTGVIKFGTFTGTGDLATNGYITIQDAGGTSRRLAVVP